MPETRRAVFLLDVDNTLLDNDRVIEDLRAHFVTNFGDELEQHYWEVFEQLREELGYADYLGALQRFRAAYPHETKLVEMSLWLVDYPFADRLYPGRSRSWSGSGSSACQSYSRTETSSSSRGRSRALGFGGRSGGAVSSTSTKSWSSTTSSARPRPAGTC